jgi:glycosyltransferase involved in cell wall biosynthesis
LESTPSRGLAFLFDCAPVSWTSREDQHFAVCRALRNRGIHPVIVFSAIPAALRQRYESAGVAIEEVNYRHGALRYFRRMREIFRCYRVDTVDIEFFTYYEPIAWMARVNGVRHIVFTESNSGVMRARSWKAALLKLRAAVMTAPVRHFVPISGFVSQQMLALGLDENRVTVIHKGIDLERYAPDRSVSQGDEIVLGTITVMRPFKHPEVILEACAELQRRGVPFRLSVGGHGELKPDMEALAGRLGIGERVQWLGYVDRAEDHLRGWDAFLLASEGEAFGFVLVEAMACEVPVVAAASGAIPEVVDDGRTGYLTPVLDAKAMADAIEKLARDHALRGKMATAARERVRDHFSVQGAVEKTLRVYESMWREPRP